MAFPFPNFTPRPRSPRPPGSPIRLRKLGPLGWTIAIVVVVIILLVVAARVWTEVLWYDQVGYVSVLVTQWVACGVLFLIAAVAVGLLVWASMFFAYRKRPIFAPSTQTQEILDRYRSSFDPLRKVAFILVPAFFGLFAGTSLAGHWQEVLLFLNRADFGEVDPQFGLDVSFYVFVLPVLRAALSVVATGFVIAGLAGLAIHYLYGGVRIGTGGTGERVTRAARAQLGATAAVLSLLAGASYWLDRYSMLMGSGEKFDGAGYTAIHANMPAKTILTFIAVFVAAMFALAAVRGNWKLPAVALGLMVVSAIIVGGVYPALIQRFSVDPNAQEKETPYIQRNIDATLAAFGLDDIESQAYTAKTQAQAGALREDADSTTSIRLLDPTVVAPTFRQLQQNKQYYDFPETLSVDRYTIGGTKRDTVIAVRDLKMSGIGGDNATWVNEHTVYTHGYGVVAAYGNTSAVDGKPAFYEGDIPPQGELGEYEPRIYFGKGSPDYSIVGSPADAEPWELDYPDDGADLGQRNSTFDGDGGPSIGNLLNKVLYAIKFSSTNILFSDRVTAESQILYVRNPADRVAKVAPYLTLDERVYPAVVDGRVVWIVDGYTTADSYPYAEHLDLMNVTRDSLTTTSQFSGLAPIPSQQVNYMTNSVKAVVDAYDGSVTLYAWDPDDPILSAWSRIYANTLTPISEISGDLMSHLRYPESLFKAQRSLLATYHVGDGASFYSGQGFWRTPDDPTRGANPQPPYYLTLKMPSQEQATFSLSSAYIPIGTGTNARNILTGFLAVDSETGGEAGKVAEGYGKLRLLQLPQSATVSGPGQVQNLFNANPTVQETLRLVKDGGSEVIYGNLLTLPVGGGLLYVEPVYIQASSGTQFPVLHRVLVSFGDQIGFAATLDKALDQVFAGDSGVQAGDAERPDSPDGGEETLPDPNDPGSGDATATPGDGPTATATTPATDPTSGTEPSPSVEPSSGASAGPTGGPTSTPSGGAAGTPAERLSDALSRANQAIQDSQAALTAGDWAAYGEAQAALQQAINDALAAESASG